ncbi:MAG: hypothetical protein WCV91_01120 [Candidatus Margulisiibacteriota bacterium]
MEVNPIGEHIQSGEIENSRFPASKRCLLFKGEACAAPRIHFESCRTCIRISSKYAVHSLFHKIRHIAKELFGEGITKMDLPKGGGRL